MTDIGDDNTQRTRFDAEVTAADLKLSPDDRERLLGLWTRARHYRDALRAAPIDLEEEPAFVEKPTSPGAQS
jgi:hypothetical protein